MSHPKWIDDVERKLAIANLFIRQPRWSLPLKGTVCTVHLGWFNRVDHFRWKEQFARFTLVDSTPLITSVERNSLHGSPWLIQPRWSTWGTRVNAPLQHSHSSCKRAFTWAVGMLFKTRFRCRLCRGFIPRQTSLVASIKSYGAQQLTGRPHELHFVTAQSWGPAHLMLMSLFFKSPMPPHVPPPQMPPRVLVDFVVLPPGHVRSVTDWCWDAHEAQLRCPDDVSGDIGGCSARRALKPKFCVSIVFSPQCHHMPLWT